MRFVSLLAELPPWAMMWGISIVLYSLLKWMSWWGHSSSAPVWKQLGYLLAWPGMNATEFLACLKIAPSRPKWPEWTMAVFKCGIGFGLVWSLAPVVAKRNGHLAGWAGMVGIIFLLHFGLFHILSCAWRRVGVNAVPIMNWPILSPSLSEFWGRRWNLAFRDLTHRFLFQPLLRRVGPVGSLLVGFMVSGLIHDLVISVPAHGGWGFPTLYFTLQGVAILIERSDWGRQIGLRSGLIGWLFCIAVIAVPSPLLFHAAFVDRVIVPFLHVIGA